MEMGCQGGDECASSRLTRYLGLEISKPTEVRRTSLNKDVLLGFRNNLKPDREPWSVFLRHNRVYRAVLEKSDPFPCPQARF